MNPDNTPSPRPLTEAELLERWPISVATLRRWRAEKKGPAYTKIGRRILYPLEAIEKYEKENTTVTKK